MIILGIETSCDETAAALVARRADGTGEILADIVRSQTEAHAPYGGVVPEIAARAHAEVLDDLLRRALSAAGLRLADADGIAATGGPGLSGGLLVGLTAAKMLALASGKPFLPINHLEGHALTARLTDGVPFPYLLLLVSGGHTQLILVLGLGRYRRLGTTLDDALGECFDKTAKILGLPYPGGPEVEKLAAGGRAENAVLPRPLKGAPGCDFSFSGLKTAVRHAAAARAAAEGGLAARAKADICAAFQAAVADILADRLDHAFALAHSAGAARLVAAGGVAANAPLRQMLGDLCAARGFAFTAPPLRYCSDNAAMIAWAGAEHLAARRAAESRAGKGAEQSAAAVSEKARAASAQARGAAGGVARPGGGAGESAAAVSENMDFAPRPRWPLDAAAPAKLGSGRKGAKA